MHAASTILIIGSLVLAGCSENPQQQPQRHPMHGDPAENDPGGPGGQPAGPEERHRPHTTPGG
ncbi:MAG: hypothetical protein ACOCXJ_07925 [Planctomycetota bacterium]